MLAQRTLSKKDNKMAYHSPLSSFLNHCKTTPNRPFLHQPIDQQWHTFTFADVESQARRIAQGLVQQGYEKGDRIGILSKNCAHWFIADLAIMMAGMISVPIYATAGQKTIAYVIEHAKLKAIFVGKLDSLVAAEKAIPEHVLRIAFPYPTVSAPENWMFWQDFYSPIEEIHHAELEDCLTIVYTSGTTGNPKGVVLTHKNLAAASRHTAHVLNVTNSDRYISYLPLAHITERSLVECVAYDRGNQIYFVESLDTFITDLKYAAPTLFLSVPRLWAKFQAQVLIRMPDKRLNFLLGIPVIGKLVAKTIRKKLGLHHARAWASGTAPISDSLLKWYQKIGINITEGWGMSETSGLSCCNFPFKDEYLGTIGVPLNCVDMKLSADKEILIRGDALFKEYYLQPDVTEKSFVNGWFRTGDCAEYTSDGAYKIVGRVKEQFKTAKGKYVAPVPIESMLGRNSYIEQVCVMGSGMKQPIALVVLGEGNDIHHNEIHASLQHTLIEVNSELESHQRLDYLYICKEPWSIENELLTPTMKLKRNLIEKVYTDKLPTSVRNLVVVED